MAFVLELEVELSLAADCVCSGADEISCAGNDESSCAWLATGENVNNKTGTKAVKKRGKPKERTINEQFPLNRADGTGRTASGISVS